MKANLKEIGILTSDWANKQTIRNFKEEEVEDIKRLSWKRNVKANLKDMGILMTDWANKQSIRNFKEEVEEEGKEVEKSIEGITNNLKL